MPTTDTGKAIASRNATSHGLFTQDVVLPALGEDPQDYQQLEAQWLAQLPPRTLLERHYVEKIAAASWRLRRLNRWQAQLFEDDTLTEDERLSKLDKVLRHETALHRQIDTAVKMLAKDAPQLYAQRAREEVLAETRTAAREYHDNQEDAVYVDLKIQDKLYHTRKATEQAVRTLSLAPLDTVLADAIPTGSLAAEQCQDEQCQDEQCQDEQCQDENWKDELPKLEPPAPASFPVPQTWDLLGWGGGAWYEMTPEKMRKRTRPVLL